MSITPDFSLHQNPGTESDPDPEKWWTQEGYNLFLLFTRAIRKIETDQLPLLTQDEKLAKACLTVGKAYWDILGAATNLIAQVEKMNLADELGHLLKNNQAYWALKEKISEPKVILDDRPQYNN